MHHFGYGAHAHPHILDLGTLESLLAQCANVCADYVVNMSSAVFFNLIFSPSFSQPIRSQCDETAMMVIRLNGYFFLRREGGGLVYFGSHHTSFFFFADLELNLLLILTSCPFLNQSHVESHQYACCDPYISPPLYFLISSVVMCKRAF